MAPVVTMFKLMESAGIGGIKKLGRVLTKDADTVVREAIFANGKTGTYRVSKFLGETTQTVFDGARKVEFTTGKGKQAFCDVYSKAKRDYIELFPRHHSWKIQEYNPHLGATNQFATGHSTITPLRVKHNAVNGGVQSKVLSNEEIHTSTRYVSKQGYGTMYERKDVLLGADGKSYPIYQQPNTYVPAENAPFYKDLTKKPIYAGDGVRPTTQYTANTPIAVLNRDLGADFCSEVKPLWSKLDEMLWHLT